MLRDGRQWFILAVGVALGWVAAGTLGGRVQAQAPANVPRITAISAVSSNEVFLVMNNSIAHCQGSGDEGWNCVTERGWHIQ